MDEIVAKVMKYLDLYYEAMELVDDPEQYFKKLDEAQFEMVGLSKSHSIIHEDAFRKYCKSCQKKEG